MKTLYLECNMGAAGDMLMAALLELHPDPEGFLGRMNALGLPGVRVEAQSAKKCGVLGTHVSVTVFGAEEDEPAPAAHHHHHPARGLADISRLIDGLPLPERVRADAQAVYGLIAGAESHVHGEPVTEIHFHEVGALDAVADVVGVCLLLSELGVDRVLASPVHVGCGEVRCAHGLLPVPAPATAHILTGVPVYGGAIRGELCTPTGAALLKHFAQAFGPMPPMRVLRVGCGMGKKDFEAANCVRALLGEQEEGAAGGPDEPDGRVAELCCNLDDMTPEAIGFAMERLFEAGALDVYTTPIGMKKNRPGVLLTCLAAPEDRGRVIRALFLHTTTLGVRETLQQRYTLRREVVSVETPDGPVRIKRAEGYGVERGKVEYDDAARIAARTGEPLAAVAARAIESARRQTGS
ncbi:MAG: nickel pincer cofactor biosynthesis protein LarC [bacterium]|nr:nickel pincer cofactor biosynthesis protein LarC [bacterium]